MSAYYNEIDPYCAQWLRNLIEAGLIAPGDIDERDIKEVRSDDLAGYTQCHFFAGIGGWSYALRLAGWPDDRPVWTGSCPCQPYSLAGKRLGENDERHLWPIWFELIRECRPVTIFGEQVANGGALGWLDTVQSDLESEDYASGAVDMCAAGVGAPHIRQRLYFVANAGSERAWRNLGSPQRSTKKSDTSGRENGSQFSGSSISRGSTCELADRIGERLEINGQQQTRNQCPAVERSGEVGVLVNAESEQARLSRCSRQPGGSYWSDCEWIPCVDGKTRPVEPGTFPLAHGVSQRMAKTRAIGNAIVPQVAAEFIGAFMVLEQ